MVAIKEKALILLVLRNKTNNLLIWQNVIAVSDKSNLLFSEMKELAEERYRIEVSLTHA